MLAAITIAAAAAKGAGLNAALVLYVGTLAALAVWHVRLHASRYTKRQAEERAESLDSLREDLLRERELYLVRLRAVELSGRTSTSSTVWLTTRELEILASRGWLRVCFQSLRIEPSRSDEPLHIARAQALNERIDACRLQTIDLSGEAVWPAEVCRRLDGLCTELKTEGGEASLALAQKLHG